MKMNPRPISIEINETMFLDRGCEIILNVTKTEVIHEPSTEQVILIALGILFFFALIAFMYEFIKPYLFYIADEIK